MSDGDDAAHLDEPVRLELLLSDDQRNAHGSIETAGSATGGRWKSSRSWSASCAPNAGNGRTIC